MIELTQTANIIANVPASWGIYWADNNEITGDEYLDAIQRAGYKATELGPYGFLGIDISKLQSDLSSRNLKCVAAVIVHSFGDTERANELIPAIRRVSELIYPLGTRNIVIMDESEFYPADKLGQLSVEQRQFAYEQIRNAIHYSNDELGIELHFHPHVGTFVEFETQIEELLNETEISLCFDTGHHAFWDQDPLSFINKYYSRIGLVHLKNVSDYKRRLVWDQKLGVRESFDQGIMVPLEDGIVDIGAVIKALIKNGYKGPLIVEQDLDRTGSSDPEILAAKNLKFVKKVLKNVE